MTSQNALTLDLTARNIAAGFSQKKEAAATVCMAAYEGSKAGYTLTELAKATSSLLAADPDSEKDSITKAAMEHRVNAARFIVENDLPYQSSTVALAYTLAQKTTATTEFKAVLLELAELHHEVTFRDVERALRSANKRALSSAAKKRAAANKRAI